MQASGKLTIPAGKTQGTIIVYAIGDTDGQRDESFGVTLSGITGNRLESIPVILDA